jgi:hypothetical protein
MSSNFVSFDGSRILAPNKSNPNMCKQSGNLGNDATIVGEMEIVEEECKEQKVEMLVTTQNVEHKRRHLEMQERKGRK